MAINLSLKRRTRRMVILLVKAHKLLILAVIFNISIGAIRLQPSTSQIALQPTTSEIQKQQLEITKLKTEIDKLNQEIEQINIQKQQSWITLFLTTIGSIVGAAGLTWTVWSGLKAIARQRKEARQNRISSLLESLSSPEEYLRLGAAKALSQYANYCFLELLATASTEDSVIVRQNIEDSLSLLDNIGKKKIIESNNKTLLDRLEFSGRIQVLTGKNKGIKINTNNLLSLSSPTISKLRQAFSFQYEYGQQISRLYLDNLPKKSELSNIQDYITKNIEPTSDYLKKLNQMTSNVIATWLKEGVNLEWTGLAIDLSITNLYQAQFKNFQGVACIFNHSLMRHCNLSKGSFHDCIFYKTQMYDCNLNQCDLKGSDLSQAHLRKASAIKAIFDGCILRETVLSEANLTKASFKNTKAVRILLNGTNLSHSEFVEVKLNQAKLKDADLTHSSIKEVSFFGAEMVNANLSHCKIYNAQFNGVDLRGADFSQSTLTNVDFSGANLSQAKFIEAKLENVNMLHARNVESAIGLSPAILRQIKTERHNLTP